MRWQIESNIDKEYIVQRALALGWADGKVQVRKEKGFGVYWYIIEPFEEGCSCQNLLRYEDFAPISADNEG